MRSDTPQPNQNRRSLWLLGGCLVTMCALFACGVVAFSGTLLFQDNIRAIADQAVATQSLPESLPQLQATQSALNTRTSAESPAQSIRELTPTPLPSATPMPTSVPATPTAEPLPSPLPIPVPAGIDQQPVPQRAHSNLVGLLGNDQPFHDYYEAAVTLGGYDVGPREIVRPERQVGERTTFDTDGEVISAELALKTDNFYFWVEDGLVLNSAELEAAAAELESYWPLVRAYFGEAWNPGVDSDPHISILHLVGSPNTFELGYFTDKDEYPRGLFYDSNEQEIVYLNMAQLHLTDDLYIGTLVHELQHLIQWNMDRNETIWLNEGLSQLAELTIGLQTATTDDFILQPDVRLNSWSYEEDTIDAHYAASYLFAVYVWEQLGDAAVQELARQELNGMASISAVLDGFAPDRSLTDFMADWTVANALDAPTSNPAFGYDNLDVDAPRIFDRVRDLPFDNLYSAEPFSTYYYDLDLSGPVTITFAGDTLANLAEVQPSSGEQMWITPGFNDTHATLTRTFDLRGVTDANLAFNIWYDLEEDYDFAYISVSNDNGTTWQMLSPPRGTLGDYGSGLNGNSSLLPDAAAGWVRETISLAPYAGQEVQVRFHVVTDFEESGRGVAIDDIAIAEIGYFSDVETDADGWEAAGFVQASAELPQEWVVRIIRNDDPLNVIDLPLNALNQAQEVVDMGANGGTLIVMATTPFINDPSAFWLRIE